MIAGQRCVVWLGSGRIKTAKRNSKRKERKIAFHSVDISETFIFTRRRIWFISNRTFTRRAHTNRMRKERRPNERTEKLIFFFVVGAIGRTKYKHTHIRHSRSSRSGINHISRTYFSGNAIIRPARLLSDPRVCLCECVFVCGVRESRSSRSHLW